ncbi:MAG: AAA family ATPase [Lewinella sp.]|uniref:AAA family ATPase n=1 Tax=Lewinella sp. TaxID=2004506 RepID=UPI003D6B95E7
MKTNQIFTPSQPAKITFIDRSTVNDQLVDALYTPGKQIAVYGYSGSGKTTLVRNKLDQVYERYIYSQCMKGTTIENLLLDAFDQLDPYYTSEKNNKISNSIGGDISAKYLNISLALKANSSEENSGKKERIIPPQLTAQNLAKFIGAVNACWVIDDFHKVEDEEKEKIAQLMKLFKDTSFEFPDTKIIVIGAVETAREIVDYDDELFERLEQIHVPLMSQRELSEIINKGSFLLNIEFTKELKNKIVSLSGSLGAVCHQLCLNMCLSKGIYGKQRKKIVFTEEDLRVAVEKYVHSKSGTMKGVFDEAVNVERTRKYKNNKIILKALVNLGKESASHSEILSKIREVYQDYPSSNLTTYLKNLSDSKNDDAMLYLDEKSKEYSIRNPFFKVYATMRFSQEDGLKEDVKISINKNVVSGSISAGGNIHIGDISYE